MEVGQLIARRLEENYTPRLVIDSKHGSCRDGMAGCCKYSKMHTVTGYD